VVPVLKVTQDLKEVLEYKGQLETRVSLVLKVTQDFKEEPDHKDQLETRVSLGHKEELVVKE
jgi:hypothetical protein